MADLHQLPEAPERTEAQDRIIEDAAHFINDRSNGSHMVGYAMVAMYSDGSGRSSSFRPMIGELEEGLPKYLGRALFRAWVEKELAEGAMWANGCEAVNHALSDCGEDDGDAS